MPESKTEAALVAAHARLHALSWLVRHQQTLCDQLRRRLDASPELLEPPRGDPQSRATRLESHLQAALKALSACAVELAKRPEPDDADEYHELHDLTRRVASALDACAALAQAAPLANAAAGRGPQLHAASARKLQDAQARVERLASENAGLRATVKKLREQSRRSMGEVSEIESASEKQNALLRVELAIAKHKGREPSQLWQERSSERSEEKKQHHRRRLQDCCHAQQCGVGEVARGCPWSSSRKVEAARCALAHSKEHSPTCDPSPDHITPPLVDARLRGALAGTTW